MKLNNYEMHLPSYSIGNAVYDQIQKLCSPYGKKVLIISGKKAFSAAGEKLLAAMERAGFENLGNIYYGENCTYEAVEALRTQKLYKECDMVFSVGGGKCIDTCKCLCIEDNKPIFTFPTIASNCAACTSVSIMYKEDGSFLKPHFFEAPPIHAFIDTEILVKAPEKYLWAGIGDTYAKYYEATISSKDEKLPHFTAMGVAISKMCLDPLIEYGEEAYVQNQKQELSEGFEQAVLAIVVSTALASIFLTRDFTPDYNSGLAHAIFYALTSYPVIEEKHLHGEVVGFGVLYALLCDEQQEEFERIYELNKRIGLPVSYKELDITEAEFDETMKRVPEMSDVRHYPYKVTYEMMKEAHKKLEAYFR